MTHPRVLQLIMDSLRYWVLEMHVDGFRFDLASALARELYDVDQARWACLMDTFDDDRRGHCVDGGVAYPLEPQSVAVFVLAASSAGPRS